MGKLLFAPDELPQEENARVRSKKGGVRSINRVTVGFMHVLEKSGEDPAGGSFPRHKRMQTAGQ